MARTRSISIDLGVVLCLLVLAACGGADTTAGSSGAGHLSDGFRPVDVHLLDGRYVSFGRTDSGDIVPFLNYPKDGSPASILTFDAASGTVTALPPVPDHGWMGNTDLAANSEFVVALSKVCADEVIQGDAGYECDSSPTRQLFAFDRSRKMWLHKAMPTTPGWSTHFDRIEGQTALFLDARDDVWAAPPRRYGLSLVDGLPETSASIPTMPRCGNAHAPAMTFNPELTTATVIDPSGKPVQYPVPESIRSRLPSLDPTSLPCSSISTFVLLRPDMSVYWPCLHLANPDPGGVSANRPDATTTTTAPCPADLDTSPTIVDLSHPERPPFHAGEDETFGQFIGNDGFWAFDDHEGLHIHRGADGSDHTIPFDGPNQRAIAVPSALLVITHRGSELVGIVMARRP